MIAVRDLSLHFGGIKAIDGTTLNIDKGAITGLIGPNGAGKTSLFNVIAGACAPTSGQVFLDGEEITGLPRMIFFAGGLLRTFQIAHEFSTLSVLENLMVVPGEQPGERLLDAWLRPGKVDGFEERIRQRAMQVIEFLEIPHLAHELAGNPVRRTEKAPGARQNHDGRCQDRPFWMKWVRE